MSGGQSRGTELRVGIFVVAALLVGGGLIFVIGNQRSVFQSKNTYHAVFDNVGGLRVGSPIRVAGVDVGTVGGVSLLADGKIRVELSVVDDHASLLRTDSMANIGSKGLLGDRLVDITIGKGAVVPPGGTIRGQSPADFAKYMEQASGMLDEAEGLTKNLRSATTPLADGELARNLDRVTANLADVLQKVNDGRGPVHRLLTDEALAGRMDRTLTDVSTMSQELSRTARSVRAITEEIERGDGSAHDLIYGEEGTRLVTGLADATSELAILMRDVRTGDGTVHDLIYEDRANELIDNMTAISADLRAISGDVRAGRGTIGGLLVDPSIYEDVKRLVGSLERNEILRALVRYSIRNDEARGTATVRE